MIDAQQIAVNLAEEIARHFCYFSSPEKQKIKAMILKAIRPLDIAARQPSLFSNTDDRQAFARQAQQILSLLERRGMIGATNAELSEISLKYTSRISDLRALGHAVIATRESGRTFRYTLMQDNFTPERTNPCQESSL